MTLGLLTVATSWIALHSGRFEKVFEGEATEIYSEGSARERTMRFERMRYDELVAEARKRGMADLSDVRIATLETDGSISFLKFGDQGSDDARREGTENRPAV